MGSSVGIVIEQNKTNTATRAEAPYWEGELGEAIVVVVGSGRVEAEVI